MKEAVFSFFIVLSVIFSCEDAPEKPIYTFAVAGHVYGNSETFTSSVYPPFLEVLDSISHAEKIDQLILTGDVVAHPNQENWDTVMAELNRLPIDEWKIAPGNHDISPYMDQVVQDWKYASFVEKRSLFLILNTSFPGWSVDSVQGDFIRDALAQTDSIDQVFVFSHQLWWLNDAPIAFQLDSIAPNSYAGFEGPTNFWETAFPAFQELNKPVYFFAGDLGCHFSIKASYEDHHENFHFYGSGMGGAIEDNFMMVRIFQDGDVNIDRVDF